MKHPQKTLSIALSTALTAAVGMAHAENSPFAMHALTHGYMVAQADKAKEGKCGEGKCGSARKETKAKEGGGASDAAVKTGK